MGLNCAGSFSTHEPRNFAIIWLICGNFDFFFSKKMNVLRFSHAYQSYVHRGVIKAYDHLFNNQFDDQSLISGTLTITMFDMLNRLLIMLVTC